MNKRIDVDATSSDKSGFKKIFEILLRNFKSLSQLLIMVPVYIFACLIIGVSAAPGVWIFQAIQRLFDQGHLTGELLQIISVGFGFAAGFFLYGLTLLFVVSAVNFLFRTHLKEWRGPYYSAEAFGWYMHNALTYLPRFTFLDFITPSPLLNLFYQMMGMKIGKGTIINTTYISDPSLISMGKKVTVGGSVTIVAHYGQGGLLVIAPVQIGDNCTLGLKASIMGGVTIGNNVKLLPHSAVMPKTVIPDGETWGGVPAVKIEKPQSEVAVKLSQQA